MTNTILTEIFSRPIAVHPLTIKAFGSAKLGIFWSQLYYWRDKGKDDDGWIYKTQQQIFEETGLSRREQETARKIGLELGVLEEKLAGQPATVHYRVNIEVAASVVEKFLEKQHQGQLPLIKEKKSGPNTLDYLRAIPEAELKELATKYSVEESFVKKVAEDVIDYCEAKGKTYKNYKAALRNFIKSSVRGKQKTGGMVL